MEKKNDIFEASSIIDARQNLYYYQIAIEVGIRLYIQSILISIGILAMTYRLHYGENYKIYVENAENLSTKR